MKKPREAKRMSDDAVKAKTGKAWAEWLRILDTAGANKLSHAEMAAYLYKRQKLPSWWSQMIAVGYEQERGLRAKHEKPEGFTASATRTIAAPLASLFKAWGNEKARRRWLRAARLKISKTTPNKSLRSSWDGGKSRVDILFFKKAAGKSLVTVDHRKLSSAKECARMKAYWFAALNRLQEMLEV
jgi:hypothetical protein